MIRLLFCIFCWVVFSLVAAVVGFPALYLTGSMDLLWRLSLWAARAGYTLAGVRVRVVGREQLEDGRGYLFLANHASNLDPPVITNQLGRRISIIAKKELFSIPLFGRAMRAGGFVELDRSNRHSAIQSIRDAAKVLQSGMGMMVFPEGTRSPDGHLLPFKKGPFHMAMEAGVAVVPVTIAGSHQLWSKRSFVLRKGEITVTFHAPLDPHQFADREALAVAVRAAIESALPEEYRS